MGRDKPSQKKVEAVIHPTEGQAPIVEKHKKEKKKNQKMRR